MIPVLLATRMAVPDSRNGAVKSMADSLSAFIFKELRTMSYFLETRACIRPFHLPFYKHNSNIFPLVGLGDKLQSRTEFQQPKSSQNVYIVVQ